MFAGHFGVAAMAKAKAPEVPVWALMVGSQALDVAFVPLMLMGVESIVGEGYGNAVLDVLYSHSLLGTVFLALMGGIVAWLAWGRRAGVVMGGVIFSHWLLDLLVHRPDLPFLPGNGGGLPLLGMSLWDAKGWSIAAEGLLILIGAAMYYAGVLRGEQESDRRKAHLKGILMSLFLVAALLVDIS